MTVAELETKYTNLIRSLIAETEEATAARLLGMLKSGTNGAAPKAAKAKKRAKVDMACRAKGCKARSKGPRFRFMCEKHLAGPKKPKTKKAAKAKKPAATSSPTASK
jgi:hypothetical protein